MSKISYKDRGKNKKLSIFSEDNTMNINEVIEKIGKDKLLEFEDFMIGQTVEIKEDKSINYYSSDVERFIRLQK